MKYIKTDWDIPYYNMAFENYVMNNDAFDEDYVFFYIHRPSIIVGKHQNTIAEINEKYVREHGIIVSRRNTGGGAVYHDEQNLNYSFIFNKKGREEGIDFSRYCEPIIRALGKLGVEAELSGRNDILVAGKKISGTAQGHNSKKILHHGTLLFNVDVEAMVNSLNVSEAKIESKAIKSVRSRVVNLSERLGDDMDILKFRDFLLEEIFEGEPVEEYVLTDEDLAAVEKLVEEKFSTWEYNYGYSPKFRISNHGRIEGAGEIEIGISVKEGRVTDMKITGDFFSVKEGLEDIFIGRQFRIEDFRDALKDVDINEYISGVTEDDFLGIIFV